MFFRSKCYDRTFDAHGHHAVRIRRILDWLAIGEDSFDDRMVTMKEELNNSKYHEFHTFAWDTGFDSEGKIIDFCWKSQTDAIVFTDGSFKENMTGSAAVLYKLEYAADKKSLIQVDQSVSSSTGNSSYMAEMAALALTNELVDRDASYQNLVVLTDSQALLRKMHKGPSTHSDMSWASTLNSFNKNKTHTWAFVRSHSNISGNDKADHLANVAREEKGNFTQPVLRQ